jgi:hypothetical protein
VSILFSNSTNLKKLLILLVWKMIVKIIIIHDTRGKMQASLKRRSSIIDLAKTILT